MEQKKSPPEGFVLLPHPSALRPMSAQNVQPRCIYQISHMQGSEVLARWGAGLHAGRRKNQGPWCYGTPLSRQELPLGRNTKYRHSMILRGPENDARDHG